MPKLRTHVLMYHDVVADDPDATGFVGPGAAQYKLPWATFVVHLDRIRQLVSEPPALMEDILTLDAAVPSWSLTFDDGGARSYEAGEELARRSWRGHFYVTTDLIGEPGFLDPSAIAELRAMGHIIGSHSASHPPRITSLSDKELLDEWRTSVEALSDLLSEDIRTASVPGGYYAPRVAALASRAGISALFTSEPVRAPHTVGECLVIGRFSVKRNTSARDAAQAAAGRPMPWLRQYAGWNVRKPAKAIIGESYERVRRQLLATSERRRP
jgi:peptidoglycan/xylan/chitin deacetylase (PgdA/CDA1 family)